MAWVQADVETLKAAIASGALSVRYSDGREVTYRSLAELRDALALVQGEVSATTGQSRFRRIAIGSGITGSCW